MRRWMCSAVAVCLTVGVSVRADDSAVKTIDAAIKAHGGAEVLTKYRNKGILMKGRLKVHDPMEIDATMEMTYIGNKFKQEVQLSIMGMDINQVVVFDGKEAWVAINGKVAMTLDKKEDVDLITEAVWAEEAGGLIALKDKDVTLSTIGEDKVNDTPVIGIRVSKKGRKDVSLFFDKKTMLLKKMTYRSMDFTSRMEVEQDRVMDEYKEFEGQKIAMKSNVYKEGKRTAELDLTEVKFVDTVDEATFNKPKE